MAGRRCQPGLSVTEAQQVAVEVVVDRLQRARRAAAVTRDDLEALGPELDPERWTQPMAYPTEEGSSSSARRARCPGIGRLVAVIRNVPDESRPRDGDDVAFGRGRGGGQVGDDSAEHPSR